MTASNTFCSNAWFGNSFTAKVFTAVALLAFLITFGVMNFCYINIFMLFLKLRKTAKRFKGKELLVIQKCFSITVGFSICSFPEVILVLYEVASGTQSTVLLTRIASLCISFTFIVDPLLLIYFDARIRNELIDMFPSWHSIQPRKIFKPEEGPVTKIVSKRVLSDQETQPMPTVLLKRFE